MKDVWTILIGQEAAGLAVTATIGALFVLGLLDVAAAWLSLGRERGHARGARAKLGRDAAIPSQSAERLLGYLDVPASSLMGNRISRVFRLRAAGIGYRDVPQRLMLERVESRGAFARYVATILTLLGLVGTVVGMTAAMLRMSGAFSNVNNVQALSSLIQALSGTLEGMKTAFACTLAGLASAVLLSFANHLLRRYQSVVIRELESTVVCDLLPRLEQVDPDSEAATKAFASVLGDASGKLQALVDAMTAAAAAYVTGGETVRIATSGLSAATTELSANVTLISGNQQDFTTTMGAVRTSIEQLTVTMAAELAAVRQFGEQSTELLTSRLEGIDRNLTDGRALQETIQRFASQFQAHVDHTAQQLDANLKTLLHDLVEQYGRAVESHDGDMLKRVDKLLAEHGARTGTLHGDLTSALRSFSDIMIEAQIAARASQFAGGIQ